MLTVTEPDRGHPHRDEPVDLKRGQVYVLHNHLEVVEDLSFLREPGRIDGNRKARRVFDWDYGVHDTKGERQQGRRGHDRDRAHDFKPRRDDDDYEGRCNQGNRCHRSISAWARNNRCRGGAEDCISSNRWHGGHGESPPHRSRQAKETTQVWRVKEHKKEKKVKRVCFADPIATELKAPKAPIQDDSIMLIKGIPSSPLQINVAKHLPSDSVHLNPSHVVPDSYSPKEVEGRQGLDPICTATTNKEMEHQNATEVESSHLKEVEHHISTTDTIINLPRRKMQMDMELRMGMVLDSILVSPNSTPTPDVTIPSEVRDVSNPEQNISLKVQLVIESANIGENSPTSEDPAQQKEPKTIHIAEHPGHQTVPETTHSAELPSHQPQPEFQLSSTDSQQEPNSTEPVQTANTDTFLESISQSIPQPLLWVDVQSVVPSYNTPNTYKRQSTRLAQKASANTGKGTIEIAQTLLVKKLGDLAGADKAAPDSNTNTEEFDLYAQHFTRPMEKTMLGAIQDLIE